LNAVLQEFQRDGDDWCAVGVALEGDAPEGGRTLLALGVLRNDGRLGVGVVDGREDEVSATAGVDNLPSLQHASVVLQCHLDAAGQLGRHEHSARESRDAVTLLDERTVLWVDAVGSIEEVVVECPAVGIPCLGGLVGATVTAGLVGLLGLSALDVEEPLLVGSSPLSLLVVANEVVPPLLLLGSELPAVSRLAKVVYLLVQRRTLLFQFFEFL